MRRRIDMAAKKKPKKLSYLYHVHYVEDSSPKIKSFASKSSLDRFVEDFKVRPSDGYWIDFTVKGKFLLFFSNYGVSKP